VSRQWRDNSHLRKALAGCTLLFDMLKKLIGYLFATFGFLGYVFFKNYKGSDIPYPSPCYILCSILGLAGLFLIYKSKSSSISDQERFNQEILNRLKQKGERILLTLDNCEIRENNYYQETIKEGVLISEVYDALYDTNRNYHQDYIEQSAIIYYYKTDGKKNRMTSQSFSFNAATLTNYVKNKKIVLYVNRFDKEDYAFELIN
jgi:hypothetical protein